MANLYAKWDSANKGSAVVLSNGDLTATSDGSATWHTVICSMGKNSGKHILELHKDNTGGFGGSKMGFTDFSNAAILPSYLVAAGKGISWSAGAWEVVGGFTASGAVPADGVKSLLFYLDIDAGKGWIADANVWANSGDPIAGTNNSFTFTPNSTIYPACSLRTTGLAVTGNFGATAWVNNTVAAALISAVPTVNNGWFEQTAPIAAILNARKE